MKKMIFYILLIITTSCSMKKVTVKESQLYMKLTKKDKFEYDNFGYEDYDDYDNSIINLFESFQKRADYNIVSNKLKIDNKILILSVLDSLGKKKIVYSIYPVPTSSPTYISDGSLTELKQYKEMQENYVLNTEKGEFELFYTKTSQSDKQLTNYYTARLSEAEIEKMINSEKYSDTSAMSFLSKNTYNKIILHSNLLMKFQEHFNGEIMKIDLNNAKDQYELLWQINEASTIGGNQNMMVRRTIMFPIRSKLTLGDLKLSYSVEFKRQLYGNNIDSNIIAIKSNRYVGNTSNYGKTISFFKKTK